MKIGDVFKTLLRKKEQPVPASKRWECEILDSPEDIEAGDFVVPVETMEQAEACVRDLGLGIAHSRPWGAIYTPCCIVPLTQGMAANAAEQLLEQGRISPDERDMLKTGPVWVRLLKPVE